MTKFGSRLGGPEHRSLEHALRIVHDAFGRDNMPYLVGSATERADYRDVDVRIILDDVDFNAIFGGGTPGSRIPLWSLLTVAISEYLAKRTGLPVDFQIQRRSEVKTADWDKPRHPLGMFCD